MNCTTQPFATNGTWNEQTKQVAWSKALPSRAESPSYVSTTMLFAFWSDPNEEFQRKHFGRVVLAGSKLGEYCVWCEAIDEISGQEWDLFLTSLTPQDKLLERLANFRFAEEADTDVRKSDASTPRELIGTALKHAESK